MMNEKELIDRTTRIVCEQLGLGPQEFKLTAGFVADLGADSLDTVELVMALEDEFGIEIADEDAEKAVTVGDAVILLAKQLDVKLTTIDPATLTPSRTKTVAPKNKPVKRKKMLKLVLQQVKARHRESESAIAPLMQVLQNTSLTEAEAVDQINKALDVLFSR